MSVQGLSLLKGGNSLWGPASSCDAHFCITNRQRPSWRCNNTTSHTNGNIGVIVNFHSFFWVTRVQIHLIMRDINWGLRKFGTSIYAALMAFCASSTAVSNPNVLSISNMSLSIVLGTPTTDTFNLRFWHWIQLLQHVKLIVDARPFWTLSLFQHLPHC